MNAFQDLDGVATLTMLSGSVNFLDVRAVVIREPPRGADDVLTTESDQDEEGETR